ncbi:DivIVA domain protein [Mobiluncus holmesii ATCC 35242]|uniref:Cell wall synthesis protein Wag31 n=1 Tax=Mobiluncus holmesii ATCC 35242 TaxID=887899 RepID=E6M3L2_9ACTO|nr:DivIVA domain-containing protein [Mobiluncus holmesii]EFU82117.1 DivIVA domain protein [Mobiluncus holmesii ATCC 35242]
MPKRLWKSGRKPPDTDEVTNMALLTTDDIVNKKFQPTKFREGYDQDEVDDFLDEVVNTLDTLTKERDSLRAELDEANRKIAELSSGVAPVAETVSEPVVPEPAPVAEPAPATGEVPESTSAVSMLDMAQRLHDEYVQDGQKKGEEIIADARVEADRIVAEAEQEHTRVLTQLEQERGMLERKIEELKTFESEYRSKMSSFLEGILSDLANSAPTN